MVGIISVSLETYVMVKHKNIITLSRSNFKHKAQQWNSLTMWYAFNIYQLTYLMPIKLRNVKWVRSTLFSYL